MFHELSMMDILFRLSIFLLLGYKIFFLMREHLIPWLRSIIRDEHNRLTEYIEKEKLLVATQKRIDAQIHVQRQMFTLLERNMHRWHQVQLVQHNNALEEQNRLNQEHEVKLKTQQQNLVLHKNMQTVMPIAIRQSQDALMKKFSGPEGQVYLSSLIKQLDQ